ncbi:MAG: S8 family serine peptidase [Gemmatimonadota bacterium]|nr:S8 family serine peptidase [Gemmatimonadota bacterium]MDQ8168561.1 S8 family serine peptidase [Gemmatimonadota bacterium]MDQ8173349.1 S8 family serine peptidase [Gemmatimonadota bacterium]
MKRALLIFMTMLSVGCRSDAVTSSDSHRAAFSASTAREQSYIVVLQPDARDVSAVTAEWSRQSGRSARFTYSSALKGFAATMSDAQRDAWRQRPDVAFIEPDVPVFASASGARVVNPNQWALDRIDQRASHTADYLYGYEAEGDGVEVHILDTGVRLTHLEFGTRARSLYDYVSNDAVADDCNGHGTHVAGTVAGATVGVARRTTVYSARVLDCSGTGTWSAVIAAIDSVTRRKQATPAMPMVGNLSLGSVEVLQSAITAVENSVAAGVVWVVAAGNDGVDACLTTPAAATGALTVASVGRNDVRSASSNTGPCVDLFAPGDDVWSASFTGDQSFTALSGTSMAAPHAAGVAALFLSANPTASPATVNAAINAAATPNVVTGAPIDTPNRLLNSLVVTGMNALPANSYVLAAALAGTGSGSVTATGVNCAVAGNDCAELFAAGTSVSVTAKAASGSVFTGWSGACTGTGGCLVSMSSAKLVNATFGQAPAMHVGDLEGVRTAMSKSWTASLTVTIHDRQEARVAGAVVAVSWSGAASGSGTCTTTSVGTCTLTRTGLSNGKTSITFTVTGVTKAGVQYLAVQNHDATINSNGTTFSIYK